jgi:hypothetical protein
MIGIRSCSSPIASFAPHVKETWLREHQGLVGPWISTQGDCV